MALVAEDIQVPGNGRVYTADVGSTFPAFGVTPDDADWFDLGYFTPDGVTFSLSRETNDIYAFQSLDPVRTVITQEPKTVAFELMQVGRAQYEIAFGGGTWDTTTDVHTYTPPDAGATFERAVLVELNDGATTLRIEIPRAINKEGVEWQASKNEAMNLPITLSILTPNTGAAYLVRSNAGGFAAPVVEP